MLNAEVKLWGKHKKSCGPTCFLIARLFRCESRGAVHGWFDHSGAMFPFARSRLKILKTLYTNSSFYSALTYCILALRFVAVSAFTWRANLSAAKWIGWGIVDLLQVELAVDDLNHGFSCHGRWHLMTVLGVALFGWPLLCLFPRRCVQPVSSLRVMCGCLSSRRFKFFHERN